ncbi:6-phosphogluconate dehydrogenase C-terminal domain-like protein, partial [Aspergillus ellipticus CBS 707.79]
MSLSDFTSVGFIGLGAMGKHMASQLALKLPPNARLHIYDIARAPMEELTSKYPTTQITTTTTTTTTTDPTTKTTTFYDAPVSGGTLSAATGTIAFFLGCASTSPHLPQLTTLLHLMGSTVIPCGNPSAGLTAKLCNNYLSGLIAIGSSEALNMGIHTGLDPRVLSRVFAAGTAQNAICDRYNPCPGVVADAPSSQGYEGGLKVQLMKKDFGLAVGLAGRVGARLVLGEKGLETYQAVAEDPECSGRDSR